MNPSLIPCTETFFFLGNASRPVCLLWWISDDTTVTIASALGQGCLSLDWNRSRIDKKWTWTGAWQLQPLTHPIQLLSVATTYWIETKYDTLIPEITRDCGPTQFERVTPPVKLMPKLCRHKCLSALHLTRLNKPSTLKNTQLAAI